MATDREKYVSDFSKARRIACYPSPDVKTALNEAVKSGLASSVSQLSSDIIQSNYKDHIEKLKSKKEDD